MAEQKAQPVIWARPRPSRGPAPKITLEELARHAIEIADEEGIDGLTMRRLGAGLGRGTMSVYRQIQSKSDLIDLMLDEAVGEIELVSHDTWREGLHWLGHTIRDHALRHPWMLMLLNEGPYFGPKGIGYTEHVLGLMSELDLPIDEIMLAIGLVNSYARGFARQEVAQTRRLAEVGLTVEEWMRLNSGYVRGLLESGKYPQFNRVIIEAEQPHMVQDEAFEYGLQRVLNGVAAGLPGAS
ncbi:TetR/AcrR family transcriptional regulator [Actinocorallia longicatena]|uniref:TetR/AcrR family transcriptional regulator C-terminal domain-containing protein n=1 Tax=Actinocorallia longicatena TaxID=111803 RepID=A0ABP6QNJ9_9ACTN